MILREELYRLVWAEPMTKVAARFEVSGSYMARVCESLNVPRPPRGHWAKLAVGKAEPAPVLPEPRASDPLGWSNDGAPIPRPKPAVPTPRARRAATHTLVPAVHTLVSGAKALILRSRPVDEGAFLKPFKRLLVDIMTSQSCLDRAVSLANELFNAFEAAGHRVALAAASSNLRRTIIDEREAGGSDRGYNHYPRLWSPDRPTIVSIGTVAIGLSVVEMSEHVTLRYVNGRYVRDTPEIAAKMARSRQYSWTTTSDVPSGRLRVVAYSPYGRVDWSRIWQEAKAKEEGIPVGPIVKAVVGHASDLIAKLAEAERQAEIEHQAWLAQQERWRRDDDQRRVEQSIQESSAALSEVIERWSRVMEIERFFQGVENRASTLASDEKAAVLERLAFAREFLGSRDPLDFFRNWRTPRERYQPIYSEEPDDVVQSSIINHQDRLITGVFDSVVRR